MKLSTDSEMLRAFLSDCKEYAPVFQGQSLAVEGGLPESSLNNLRQILDFGLGVLAVWTKSQNVLVILSNGESYLATGFTYGVRGEGTLAFARFLSEAGWGEVEPIYRTLMRMDENHYGVVVMESWLDQSALNGSGD